MMIQTNFSFWGHWYTYMYMYTFVKKCNTLMENHEDGCVNSLYERNPLQSLISV